MATTRYSQNIAGTPVKTARFDVTADNDVLFAAAGDMLVLGFIAHGGVVSALNVDAGVDITAYPQALVAAEELCVTTAGADSVTVFFVDCPVTTYSTQNT